MEGAALSRTRIRAGVWEGLLTLPAGAAPPPLRVTHAEAELPPPEVAEAGDPGLWTVKVAIPLRLLSDGVQTFVIADAATGERLASFAVLAGEALADDIRAELDLLRAELELLKQAFRRHCAQGE
jgi:hypothetical protein